MKIEIESTDTKKYISIKDKNAYVGIVIKPDYYHYCNNIQSDLRICVYNAQQNKKIERAPPGHIKKLLIEALSIIDRHFPSICCDASIVAVEADDSPNNDLVTKVYEPLGFKEKTKWIENNNESGKSEVVCVLMMATLGELKDHLIHKKKRINVILNAPLSFP